MRDLLRAMYEREREPVRPKPQPIPPRHDVDWVIHEMFQRETLRYGQGYVNPETIYDREVNDAKRWYDRTALFCGYNRKPVVFGIYSFPAVRRTRSRVQRAKNMLAYVDLLLVLLDDVVMLKPKENPLGHKHTTAPKPQSYREYLKANGLT